MWLSIAIVIAIVGGIALAIASSGFWIIPVVIVLIIAAVAKTLGRSTRTSNAGPASGRTVSSTGAMAGDETPQDTETRDKAHVKTGYANPGQAHMTPEQEPEHRDSVR
jgi:hypothetical protein